MELDDNAIFKNDHSEHLQTLDFGFVSIWPVAWLSWIDKVQILCF